MNPFDSLSLKKPKFPKVLFIKLKRISVHLHEQRFHDEASLNGRIKINRFSDKLAIPVAFYVDRTHLHPEHATIIASLVESSRSV